MNLFRCRRCLYPNTKPDIRFNLDGICRACEAYDARSRIDWKAKQQEFLDLCYENAGSSHDVVVAVSGGKDSTWQVLKCIELGLKPLAVCATTDDLSSLGRKNLDNIAELCDLIEITPHKPTRRRITKFALQEVGDISWCEHVLIWSVPAREAVARGIKLVLYGECPQNEYGAGPAGSEKNTDLTYEWMHEFGGMLGLRLADVADIVEISQSDLDIYRAPPDGSSYRAVFMGAYFPWDGLENARVARQHGFTPYGLEVEGSIGSYENLDNLQTGIHDYLRFLKFGYGRACDILSNWLRRGLITRETAAARCQSRDGAFPMAYLGVALAHTLRKIDITVPEFYGICERFTNGQVVEWASQPESYQCFSGTTTDASKVEASTSLVA